jgi:hypothetical protein
MAYLPDATVFTDMAVKDKPGHKDGALVLCPKCKGYGGWILKIDAYGPGRHFQAACSQCNSWGWVEAPDAECLHEWRELSVQEARSKGISHFGMCYHVVECKHCGRIRSYDSSG